MGQPQRVAFYLRDPRNLHYLAGLRPYLDHYRFRPDVDARVVIRSGLGGARPGAELRGYLDMVMGDDRLDRYDLVVTPSFLRPEERPPGVRAVQVFHGLSDKPFTYGRDFRDYALCLCAGRRQLDRLLANPANWGMRWTLIGYPKFDNFARVRRAAPGERKRVIYCPTWSKGGLSSLHRFLAAPHVAEAIAEDFELWIKPHPNTLNPRRPYFDPEVVAGLKELAGVPGIRILRSGNVMPWFSGADIYVGDVSATGYEWLYFNRPMVFLNPKPGKLFACDRVTSHTYLWQAGHVCDDPENLRRVIQAALDGDANQPIRERILEYSVYQARDGQATNRGITHLDELLGIRGQGIA